MTAELADAWLPAFYMAEGADAVWGEALRKGNAKRDPGRPPLDIYAGGGVGIGEGLESYRDMSRPGIALYIGGMGAKEKNFYNQSSESTAMKKKQRLSRICFLPVENQKQRLPFRILTLKQLHWLDLRDS